MKSVMHDSPFRDQESPGSVVQRPVAILLVLLLLAGQSACEGKQNRQEFSQLSELPLPLSSLSRETALNHEPVRALQPLRLTALQASRAALGKRLFHDTRLSGDGTVACVSCHDIQNGGDDGRPTSVGVRGQSGKVNSPTVLNSGYNFRQFWDGRAESLNQQAMAPVVNPAEMDANWTEVVQRLSSDSELVAMFDTSFGQKEITAQRVASAIASYERTLLTPSPFDSYLNGDEKAISHEAASGYVLFKELGCVACHQGVNLGGNLMQYFGAFHSVDLKDNSSPVNKATDSVPLYKVPTLRNVALTSPYFHTGSVSRLSDAVRVMGSVQLGRVLSADEVQLLVAFLESLTGEIPPGAQPGVQMTAVEQP